MLSVPWMCMYGDVIALLKAQLGEFGVIIQAPASANRGLPLPLDRRVCDTKSKKGAPDTENPSYIGFTVLGGGLRPWSQTMPDLGVGVDPSLLTAWGQRKT